MAGQKRETRKTYSFRQGMPDDVYAIIIREQNIIKAKNRTTVYSIERTIYQIIRNFDKLKRLNECPE
jgi:uncharacterized protein YjcR